MATHGATICGVMGQAWAGHRRGCHTLLLVGVVITTTPGATLGTTLGVAHGIALGTIRGTTLGIIRGITRGMTHGLIIMVT